MKQARQTSFKRTPSVEMERIIGIVRRVNGPVIEAEGITHAMMLEFVRVGELKLVGELIKLESGRAIIQVYEDTTGIAPGDNIYGSGLPISVELGPGLLGSIYDGIQRPLESIYEISGNFIERGIAFSALNRKKKWHFVPSLNSLDMEVKGGMVLGTVKESKVIEHRILSPPDKYGILKQIAGEGEYSVDEPVAVIKTPNGEESLNLMHRWPIRIPRPVGERLPVHIPLITGQRVIDTLFPIAKGSTVAIPGGFGTGKTMTQHALAKWCDARNTDA